ncbi:hypothetical protein OG338_05170 [Streptomyces sp. NBC_00726]|uniref:hypothetical protein n=1 Tax=Streptomyces sp. NBC_00726 TaxID=2903674 RepID=UPI003867CF72
MSAPAPEEPEPCRTCQELDLEEAVARSERGGSRETDARVLRRRSTASAREERGTAPEGTTKRLHNTMATVPKRGISTSAQIYGAEVSGRTGTAERGVNNSNTVPIQ